MNKENTKVEAVTGNDSIEAFNEECKVIDLRKEYVGYSGNENWAIVSELSEDKILEKYSDQVVQYIPFVLLSVTQGKAIYEYKKNDKKHEMRQYRKGVFQSLEVLDAYGVLRGSEKEGVEDTIETLLEREELWLAVLTLSEKQKHRIIKHFYGGKSIREIAREEEVAAKQVKKSIDEGIKKLKEYLN